MVYLSIDSGFESVLGAVAPPTYSRLEDDVSLMTNFGRPFEASSTLGTSVLFSSE